jgi:hypothetical protein
MYVDLVWFGFAWRKYESEREKERKKARKGERNVHCYGVWVDRIG